MPVTLVEIKIRSLSSLSVDFFSFPSFSKRPFSGEIFFNVPKYSRNHSMRLMLPIWKLFGL